MVQVVTMPTVSCPRCRAPNGPQARFCADCGTPFPPPVVPVPGYPATGTLRFAGFWRRAFALFFDLILLLLILLPIHFLSRWVFDEILSRTVLDPAGRTFDRMNGIFGLADQAAKCGIVLFYFVMFERSKRQATIGKMITGCRVADKASRRAGIVRVTLRNLLKPISALPCFIGLLMAAVMPEKQALHDLISGTRTVKKTQPG